MKNILAKHIADKNALWLFSQIIDSFNTEWKTGVGLPLGNLTSQLFVNIYMNKFDHFIKRELKACHYIRYVDDFVIFSENKNYLENFIPKISEFLEMQLKLSLHPDKVSIKTFSSGVDFLGWINFPEHRTLRTSTKRRMIKRLKKNLKPESVALYFGLLSHGNTQKLYEEIEGIEKHCKIF